MLCGKSSIYVARVRKRVVGVLYPLSSRCWETIKRINEGAHPEPGRLVRQFLVRKNVYTNVQRKGVERLKSERSQRIAYLSNHSKIIYYLNRRLLYRR